MRGDVGGRVPFSKKFFQRLQAGPENLREVGDRKLPRAGCGEWYAIMVFFEK